MLNFLFQSGFFLKKLYFYSSSMQKNVFMTLASHFCVNFTHKSWNFKRNPIHLHQKQKKH